MSDPLRLTLAMPTGPALDALTSHLSELRLELTQCTSLEALARRLERSACDMLLLDEQLDPEALEFLSNQRDDHEFEATAVICVQRADMARRLEVVRAGASGIIQKPIDMASVLEMLNAHLSQDELESSKHILLIEDSLTQREVMTHMLQKEGFEVTAVEGVEGIMEIIIEHQIDLILTDLYLKQCDGFELAQVIKQWDRARQIPIVMLSSEGSAQVRRKILRSGVDDYLLKPVHFGDLLAVINGTIARTQRFRRLIQQDSLTGLINHGQMFQRLRIELKRATRQGTGLCVVMIDLDNFKHVNDTYGHLAGDEVLRRLSLMLKHRLRHTDVAGRYGGEEIALILPDTRACDAMKLTDSLRAQFAQLCFNEDQEAFRVSFSFGVACMSPQGPELSCDQLWQRADEAMYRAKRSGKNQGQLYSPIG